MGRPFKVCERVYMVGGPDITDARDCCIYLVDGGDELALIDTGTGRSCGAVQDNILSLGLNPSLLRYVVATHGHIDHIGGLHYFQARGAKVSAHVLEKPAIVEGRNDLTGASYYGVKYQPVTIDLPLDGQKQDLSIGDLTLHCLFTPGHTPGGISPYLDVEGTRILFGQDIHGPFDPSWGSDMESWRRSMQELLALNADILCEGHFGIYQPAHKVRNYIEYYLKQY